jgi:hypothetical protein
MLFIKNIRSKNNIERRMNIRTTMQTRSQTKKQGEFVVSIDFEESSRAWMQNKRKTGGGSYEYIRVSSTQDPVKTRRSERIRENKKNGV